MIMTLNKSIDQNMSNKQDYEEYDESIIPKNVPHDMNQHKNQKNLLLMKLKLSI